VNKKLRRELTKRKRHITQRLDRFNYPEDLSRPMMRETNIHYELAEKSVGTAYGGIGLMQRLGQKLDLAQEIDARLHLFKVHLPYHESDHVLNLAYNILCDGRSLEDLELRRQDEAYLNALGASRLPDSTTAGDFCRRFERQHLTALQHAFDAARLKAWSQQPTKFFAQAIIEADGTMVTTNAECKQGIDINYKGEWGYHPLVLTLANTGEVLRLVNRSGNRPSHEGAAVKFDESIELCRAAGFKKCLLRGDTDFSQTQYLDRWHEQGDVTFIFGYDCSATLHILADDLPDAAWQMLKRPAKYRVKTHARTKPKRVKQKIVEARGFKDIQLDEELVAEFRYQPTACSRAYRMVVVRKNLTVNDPQQGRLFAADYRYFFYITNDESSTAEQIVFSANDRCQQENVLSQLHGSRALHSPVDTLLANEAYMLMASLAWNLKAWLALQLPEEPPQREGHSATHVLREDQAKIGAEKKQLLGLEFRTFVNYFLRMPTQVVKSGRRLVLRVLAWNDWQPVFMRLAEILTSPRRGPARL
jgi:hypothetical protein